MKQDLSSISFITGRCSFVPAGRILVYRWPGPNHFNVLGYTKPTNEQAIVAISEFCKHEAERAAAPQRVEGAET